MSTFHSVEAPDCGAGLLSPEHRDDEWSCLPKIYEGADGRIYERCDKPIGSGGFGFVFEATARPSGTKVALKVAKKSQFELRDMRVYERLGDMPGVVRVLDHGRKEGRDFVVMEFIDGPTLDTWVAEKRVSAKTGENISRWWLPVFDQILLHVTGVHTKGHSHNDLKLTNVLMQPNVDDFSPLLSDLGLARRMPTSSSTGSHAPPAASIQYCSPEQFKGALGSPQSDVFSLIVIFIELLTGNAKTQSGDSWAELVRSNAASQRAYARENRTAIDLVAAELAAFGINPNSTLGIVLRKGLALSPTDRYQNAHELRDALRLRRVLHIYHDVEVLGTSLSLREIEALRRDAQELRPLCDDALDMLDDFTREASASQVRSTRGAIAMVFAAALSLGGFVCIVARPGGMVDKSRMLNGDGHARVQLESLPNTYPPPPPSTPLTTPTAPTGVTTPSSSRGALRAQDGLIDVTSFNDIISASRNECPKPAQAMSTSVVVSFDADGRATIASNPDLDVNPTGRCVIKILRRWIWKTGQPHVEAYWLGID
ncbi:serine/threonine-protein kinase [Sorangium sp. So ce764]|uniref:serine/threonine protein kinase n=1 Tax=Sorangium sp. So ce764 TaxID=3133320 RepID=UPI003F5E1CEF